MNEYSDDLVKVMNSVEGEQSMYTVCAEEGDVAPHLVFCFGRAIGSEIGIQL